MPWIEKIELKDKRLMDDPAVIKWLEEVKRKMNERMDEIMSEFQSVGSVEIGFVSHGGTYGREEGESETE